MTMRLIGQFCYPSCAVTSPLLIQYGIENVVDELNMHNLYAYVNDPVVIDCAGKICKM